MKRIITLVLLAVMLMAAGTEAQAQRRNRRHAAPQTVENSEVIANFRQHIEQTPYLSEQAIRALNDKVTSYIDELKDLTDRDGFIADEGLESFLASQREELQAQQNGMQGLIDNFLRQYQGIIIADSAACRDSLQRIVNDRLGRLETNLNLLEREMNAEAEPEGKPMNWVLIGGIAGGVLLLIIIIALLRSASRKKPGNSGYSGNPGNSGYSGNSGNSGKAGDPGIVVRRKTATILKKQSLEDVMDNPNYLKVDLEDCCYESAVRRMYLKNKCVVDIYNMYTNDLEHPDQAKEYGCMVLGRWVHDPENNEYYVSLEEIVLPGDDAIFEEYELNFGGKIKLRVHEMLRKLRSTTNLQYDLTCWVHSHPGLTVFFSNSDSSVQDQLKHPQHPNFLTALVIDTLTPSMETGVFTFHRDHTLNSKNDLKKLYSLKEWYQWAQQSLKENGGATPQGAQSPQQAQPAQQDQPAQPAQQDQQPQTPQTPQQPVKPQEPSQSATAFDTLASAKEHTTACYGIELTRDMVVDICMALVGQSNGVAGIIHGTSRKEGPVTVHTADRLSNKEKEEDLQPLGRFVVAQHCSLPTVRKAIGDDIEKLKFVLVYTTADGQLTSIPVISGDLCADASYYGEQGIDELRQWTKGRG